MTASPKSTITSAEQAVVQAYVDAVATERRRQANMEAAKNVFEQACRSYTEAMRATSETFRALLGLSREAQDEAMERTKL